MAAKSGSVPDTVWEAENRVRLNTNNRKGHSGDIVVTQDTVYMCEP